MPAVRPSSSPNERDLSETLTDRSLPANGFNMNVHVLYDLDFSGQFGSKVSERIDAVFAHIKNFFLLPSLGTKIYPTIVAKTAVNARYNPRTDLE